MILLLDDAVVPASRHQCVQSYVIYACFDCSSLLPLFASDSRPSGASSTRSGTPHGASCLQHPTDRRGHLPDQTLTTNRYFRALSSQFHLSFCTPTTNAEFAFAPQKRRLKNRNLCPTPRTTASVTLRRKIAQITPGKTAYLQALIRRSRNFQSKQPKLAPE